MMFVLITDKVGNDLSIAYLKKIKELKIKKSYRLEK